MKTFRAFAYLFMFAPLPAKADLAAANEAAYKIWNPRTGCSTQYDEAKAQAAISKAAGCAIPDHGLPGIKNQQKALNAIAEKVQDKAEDRYFALSGVQYARELQCAANFAEEVTANKSEKEFGHIVNFAQSLRVARQEELKALREKAKMPFEQGKACPLSLDLLQPDPGPSPDAIDRHFEICQKILKARGAYLESLAAIPLSDLPTVKSAVTAFANLPVGTDATTAEKNLSANLRDLYANKVKKELAAESAELLAMAEKGGQSFDSAARYGLLADPRVTAKVLKDAGEDQDMKGLACRADARYGRGSDELDKTISVVTLIPVFAAGKVAQAAVKVGSAVIKARNFAVIARASGGVSMVGEKILETGLLVLGTTGNAAVAYPGIVKACSGGVRPKRSVKANDEKCVSAPTVEQLEHDSCILNQSLALLGFTGSLAAGYKLTKEASLALLGKSAVKPTGSAVLNAELEAVARNSKAAEVVKQAEPVKYVSDLPYSLKIPEENLSAKRIPDSGRLVDPYEVPSAGYIVNSPEDLERHLASGTFRDGTVTKLVVRDKDGNEHLLYHSRFGTDQDVLDGKIYTHRTLRQLWRDTHGEEPFVVEAYECGVNLNARVYGCVNMSGSYWQGNDAVTNGVAVSKAAGFKFDDATKIKNFDLGVKDNAELGHVNAAKAMKIERALIRDYGELTNELRSGARQMYREHSGNISGMDKDWYRKVSRMVRQHPEWSAEKKDTFERITAALPLFNENSTLAVKNLIKNTRVKARRAGKDPDVEARNLTEYVREFWREANKP